MSPVFPNSIEVFDLAENQDTLSPVELDPEKLAHKFKEVCANLNFSDAFFLFFFAEGWHQGFSVSSSSSRSNTQ